MKIPGSHGGEYEVSEAVRISEMLVTINLTTQQYIPEDFINFNTL
jgi:hypothetical protein